MNTLESIIQNSTTTLNFQTQLSIQMPDHDESFDHDDSNHSQTDTECTPIKNDSFSSNSNSSNSSFREENEQQALIHPSIPFNKPTYVQPFNSTPLVNYTNQSLIKIVKRKPTVNFHSIDDLISSSANVSSFNDSGNYSYYNPSSLVETSYITQNIKNESSNQETMYDDKENTKLDNKKFRTSFTEEQKKLLDFYFNKNPYPDPRETEDMSAHLGLPEHVIKVWFQNRRSRDKQRKFSRENNARLAAKKQINNEQIQSTPLISNLQYFQAAAALNAFASNIYGYSNNHF